MMRSLLLLSLGLAAACTPAAAPDPPSEPERGERPIPPPTLHEMPERLVAFGDVHGDFDALWQALTLAELIDEDGAWIGGQAVVVQTGDQLDRGDSERAILDFLGPLADAAWDAGGQVLVLNGNHETLNVDLDLRYVTEGGFADFADLAPPDDALDEELLSYEPGERGRVAAFRPGGPYARLLAGQNATVIVGDVVFVHGGILPQHAELGLETINQTISEWMLGDADEPDIINGDGPLWVRDYSDETGPTECADLEETLDLLGASTMVVGHTVHPTIHSACDGQVWRVDVGMAAYYGGSVQVLEFTADSVQVID